MAHHHTNRFIDYRDQHCTNIPEFFIRHESFRLKPHKWQLKFVFTVAFLLERHEFVVDHINLVVDLFNLVFNF